MLTLKHVESDGREGIMSAREVTFDLAAQRLTAFGVPGPNEGARYDGVMHYGSGRLEVFNDNGNTIASYDLGDGDVNCAGTETKAINPAVCTMQELAAMIVDVAHGRA
jgi:hypothetical protein